jgi:hypothetical protein
VSIARSSVQEPLGRVDTAADVGSRNESDDRGRQPVTNSRRTDDERSARSIRPAAFALTALTATALALPNTGLAKRPRPPANISPPTISGVAQVGQTLTATTGTWNGAPTRYAFKWQRCDPGCAAILGAGGTSYVVTSADQGRTLRVVVTASNRAGSNSAASAATAVVQPGASPPPPPPPPPPSSVLFSDGLDSALGPNGLITNEYAYWNPGQGVQSPNWDMTSGSFFSQGGAGYSGVPDACNPGIYSQACTNSAVFRLTTKRYDFSNVKVSFDLYGHGLSSTSSTPAVAWDGLHIFLRYQDQTHLYYASVNRRDAVVVLKKKCPGGSDNGGTYFDLSSYVGGNPIPFGVWQNVAAQVVTNPDGSVTITLWRDGSVAVQGTDTGIGTCGPITQPGAVGVRGDNYRFAIDNFTVTAAP